MQFEPNEDQSAFLSVLDQMATSPDAGWRASADWGRFDWAASFDDMLAQNGFYDCAGEESLGAAAAAAMIEQPVVWKFGTGLITHPGIPT